MKSFLKTAIANKAPAYVPRGVGAIGGLLTPSNAAGQMSAYGAVGTLFAIVNRLSNSTASVPWHLYRKQTSPDAERQEVLKHPALDLWNRPNPFYSQTEFIEAIQQHIDLVGEAWWIVSKSKLGFGPPLELWPVRPDRMAPVPSTDNFLSGYVYHSPTGEKVPLGLGDVVQIKSPNPLDPYRGMGPVQSIMADLDSERYSAAWNRNFFINGAEPGGLIELDVHMDDAEFDAFRDRWQEGHQGVANAHRVAILEKGKWVDRKMSQKDMQFVLLRETSQKTIKQAFGFPSFLLGETETVNRASSEASEYMYARWLLVPRLERIRDALNIHLLPLFGTSAQGLEFDFDSPVPNDAAAESLELKTRAEALAVLIAARADPVEACEVVGLPEMTFAEKQAVPPQLQAQPEKEEEEEEGGKVPAAFAALLRNRAKDANARMADNWEARLKAELEEIDRFIKEHGE